MSSSRKYGVGDSRRCVYSDSLHMHTLINGISVVLKLAEFGSAFKLPPCNELDTKKAARIKRRYPTCCPECKCGSGEPPPPRPLPSKTSIKSEPLISPKESLVSIKKSKQEAPQKVKKPCKPRKSFCVFKRNKSEHEPKKRKIDKPKRKPKVKKIEAGSTYSTVSITQTDTTPREDSHPPEGPEKPPSQRLSREDKPPEEPEKLPSKRERSQKSDRSTFNKNTKNKEVVLKKTKKKKHCRPVFVDVGTSTCTENTKHQYNVLQNKESGLEMYNKFDPTISGDTQKSKCSIQSSFEETPRENSDEIQYRFITYHLKEGTTPESLITTTSKSTTVLRDCLEANLSVYSPSICSMLPQRFEESQEILSTIVDHANNLKDEKGTETSTWPGIVFSTSASAQTCLIDYELFKGSGCKPKVFRKDYVVEETLTNGNLFHKTDSSSI